MFYCDPCGARKLWPPTASKSQGKCEVCGEVRLCNDLPSKHLPLPPKAVPLSFQERVKAWLLKVLGLASTQDKVERNQRFLEESLELVQAAGCSASEAHQLVDYVYGRKKGELRQEVGGVMTTLAALCLAHGVDMMEAGEVELARAWVHADEIKAKQSGKPRILPQKTAHIALETLVWWRALIDLNPNDLAPRMDAMIAHASLEDRQHDPAT